MNLKWRDKSICLHSINPNSYLITSKFSITIWHLLRSKEVVKWMNKNFVFDKHTSPNQEIWSIDLWPIFYKRDEIHVLCMNYRKINQSNKFHNPTNEIYSIQDVARFYLSKFVQFTFNKSHMIILGITKKMQKSSTNM